MVAHREKVRDSLIHKLVFQGQLSCLFDSLLDSLKWWFDSTYLHIYSKKNIDYDKKRKRGSFISWNTIHTKKEMGWETVI